MDIAYLAAIWSTARFAHRVNSKELFDHLVTASWPFADYASLFPESAENLTAGDTKPV